MRRDAEVRRRKEEFRFIHFLNFLNPPAREALKHDAIFIAPNRILPIRLTPVLHKSFIFEQYAMDACIYNRRKYIMVRVLLINPVQNESINAR